MSNRWTDQQINIFDAVENGNGNLAIVARAGCGKTTVGIEIAKRLPVNTSALFAAFGKADQEELSARLPEHVEARTLHSLGFGAIRFNNKGMRVSVDNKKTFGLIDKMKNSGRLQSEMCNDGTIRGFIVKTVSRAKNFGYTPNNASEFVENEIYFEGVVDETRAPTLHTIIMNVIKAAADMIESVDFDDMVWLPFVHGWKPKRYGVVFVDECQDMNPAQLWLARAACAPRGRTIVVGDPAQAIYAWRGAGLDAFQNTVSSIGAIEMPMSLTFRCGRKIVAVAQEYVPDFAAGGSHDGVVDSLASDDDLIGAAKPGDFIISRTNAPLMNICLALLKRGVPAYIRGRNFGQGLIQLIEKHRAGSIAATIENIDRDVHARAARLSESDADKVNTLFDMLEAVKTLAEDHKTVDAWIKFLNDVFTDTDRHDRVVLSTVHRSKGREADRVFLLGDTFNPDTGREARNIFYVAITRAKQHLTFIGNTHGALEVANQTEH